MSSYGRWRRTKIVVPASRAQEISGGIKNALDRGEPLAKAKQSFINAGYTSQEVNAASQMIKSKSSTPVTPSNPESPTIPSGSASPTQPQSTTPKPATKKSSKKLIIILSIVGVVILIAALVLGLFWDKIFK